MSEVLNVLLLEDSPRDAEIIKELLIDAGYDLKMDCTAVEKEYVSFLRSCEYDIILSDFKLPGFDSFAALKWSLEICPDLPFICVSGVIEEGLAVELLKKGAVDYVKKDRLERLPSAIKRAIEEAKEKEARQLAEERLTSQHALLKALINSQDDLIIFSIDKNYCYTAFNEKHRLEMKKVWSIDIEPGMSLLDCMSIPKLRKSAKKSIDRILQGESISEIQHQTNLNLYYEYTWTPVFQNEEITGASVFVRNITGKRQAEDKLREKEGLYRSLFDNMLNGFAYCRMLYEQECPKDFIYLSVNKAFESLTGLKNVEGKKVSEVIPGIKEADPELFEIYSKVALTGEPEVFETYLESMKMWFSISVYSPEKEYFVAVFDVVTERKQAEETLRESERKLREAQEMAHMGFWSWDIKTGNVDWSEEVFKIFLLDPKVFKPQIDSILALSPWPEDHQRDKELINRAVETHTPGHYEQKFLRPDMSIGHYYSTFMGKYDEKGDLISIVGTVLDITERQLAEEALRESEDKFKYVFDHSVIGKSITLTTGEINVNRAFCEMTGYSPDELKKKRWQDISYPDDIDLTQELLNLLISGEKNTVRFNKRYIHKNGSIVWADVGTSLRRDDSGKPLYFMTAVNDITERKKAEESLRLKNFVFDASIAANSIADINGIITEANDAFLRIWGYQAKNEVIGKKIPHFHNDPDEAAKIVAALNSTGEWEGEYTARRNDGSTFIAHGLASVVKDETGKGIAYQTAVLDITGRKNAELQIRKLNEELEQRVIQRTEQLEAANKELEAFSYSVSHDLRAPLRSVHSYTKILLEDYEKNLDEEGKRLCGIISSSATKMGDLIDDLLNFSKIGRSSMHQTLVDMKSMAGSVFDEISDENEKRRTKLKIGKLHKVNADPNLIKLVWNNLISNAIKYSSKEQSPKISIGSILDSGMIIYSIMDNGVGFDMQYKHKLFGVFQRLHSENEFEGNGVGLAIVQRIIIKHNGKVWAEGEVGKGATFYFSLPLQDKRQKTKDKRQK